MRYLWAKADGIANGNRERVIPRSLMERLMMKNSAGFKVERLWYATSSRTQFPMRDSTPATTQRKRRQAELKVLHLLGSKCELTEYAVDGTHEDVLLLGDGGGKHIRCVWSISHLQYQHMCTRKLITSNAVIEEFAPVTPVLLTGFVKALKRQAKPVPHCLLFISERDILSSIV